MSLFDEPSRKPLPQPTFEDAKHATGKSLVGMIPLVGGAGSELLGLLSSPVAQRRDDWFEDLQRRLQDLEGKVSGFHFDDLANNHQFVSATLTATQAALRTHDKEKLQALRNVVLNTVLGTEPDDDHRAIFLSFVDSLTPGHLVMLKFFDEPKGTLRRTLIEEAINLTKQEVPRLRSLEDAAVRVVFDDLQTRNLLNVDSSKQTLYAPNGRWTSNWGHSFISFITAPSEIR